MNGKLESLTLRNAAYALTFLRGDCATMTEQLQWYAGQSAYENFGLSLASDTEAYVGRLSKSRKLTRQSVESSVRTDSKENGAIWWENAAIREAAFGNLEQARQVAAEGLKLVPTSQGVEDEAALALAMAGDTTTSRIAGARPEQALSSRHPDAVSLASRDPGATGARPKEFA